MENTLKGQLYSLYSTYSAINNHLNRIEDEISRLSEERRLLGEILNTTREQEKSVINNLEKALNKELSPEEIFEIIKDYEKY